MAETTNIRQAETAVKVYGKLVEKSLKIEKVDGIDQISGYLTIKTSDVNFVRFNVKCAAKKKDGTDNSMYAGILTVMNDYKAIADDGVGEENADKIYVDTINGKNKDSINIYRSKQTGKTVVGFKASFFNRIKSEQDYVPTAEFEIETYIKAIVPEVDNEGIETDRILIHGWVPTYSGIEQITLVADKETGTAIQDTFSVGQTVRFFGDIVNNRIETVKEIPMAIGKPRREVHVEYKNDLVINGASDAYEEGVTAYAPYTKEAIDRAIQERENKEKEKTVQQTAVSRPSAASHGRTLGF